MSILLFHLLSTHEFTPHPSSNYQHTSAQDRVKARKTSSTQDTNYQKNKTHKPANSSSRDDTGRSEPRHISQTNRNNKPANPEQEELILYTANRNTFAPLVHYIPPTADEINVHNNERYKKWLMHKDKQSTTIEPSDTNVAEDENDDDDEPLMFTDDELMEMYLDVIRTALLKLSADLAYTDNGIRLATSIYKNPHLLKFLRTYREIYRIKQSTEIDLVIEMYREAFNIYKSYLNGVEWLRKTFKQLSKYLRISRKLSKIVDTETADYLFYYSIVELRKEARKKDFWDSVIYNEVDLNNLFDFYYVFYGNLLKLESILKNKCKSKGSEDENLERNMNINSEIKLAINEMVVICEKSDRYEVKFVLLIVYCELKDCVYRSVGLKSGEPRGELRSITNEGFEMTPGQLQKESELKPTLEEVNNAKKCNERIQNIKKEVHKLFKENKSLTTVLEVVKRHAVQAKAQPNSDSSQID